MAKYLQQVNGLLTEVTPNTTSAGVADAAKLVQTDSTGRLDTSLMPVGIGADTQIIIASEALAAGDVVNIWSNGGDFNVRKADATTSGKTGHGFVLAAVTSGNPATVYFESTDTQVTGLTPGAVYLSTTAGRVTNTSPSAAGNIIQPMGFATSATSFNFQVGTPILLS